MVPRFLVLGVTVGTVTLLASTASAQFVLLNGQSRTISTQNTDSDGTPEQDWDRILTYDDDGNVVENALVITDAATGDRGGPRNSDRLLRWDPDPGEGVWNATKETELSG